MKDLHGLHDLSVDDQSDACKLRSKTTAKFAQFQTAQLLHLSVEVVQLEHICEGAVSRWSTIARR